MGTRLFEDKIPVIVIYEDMLIYKDEDEDKDMLIYKDETSSC